MRDVQRFEHDGAESATEDGHQLGHLAEGLHVGLAAGRIGAVVLDHQLDTASAQHATSGVDLADGGLQAVLDGVRGDGASLAEGAVKTDHHRLGFGGDTGRRRPAQGGDQQKAGEPRQSDSDGDAWFRGHDGLLFSAVVGVYRALVARIGRSRPRRDPLQLVEQVWRVLSMSACSIMELGNAGCSPSIIRFCDAR